MLSGMTVSYINDYGESYLECWTLWL